MKIRVQRLGVMQMGKICAILYALMAVIFLPFIILAALQSAAGAMMMVVSLLMYPIMGFIGGLIFAGLYNASAGIVGGCELDLYEDTSPQQAPPPVPAVGPAGYEQQQAQPAQTPVTV